MIISVIGLGYVGLPLASLISRDFEVIGFDTDAAKIKRISKGEETIKEPDLKPHLSRALSSNKLKVTNNPADIRDASVKIITVGTPYDPVNDGMDYSQLDASLEVVSPYLKKGDVVVLKSTVPPGTTSGRVKDKIESLGFNVPEDIGIVFSPERMIEGQAVKDFLSLPKIIGATDNKSYVIVEEILSKLGGRIIKVSNPETAEMVKMIDNYSRFVFLGLTNEIAIMSEKIGVDALELIEAAKADYPRNAGILKPGPGVGGSCLNKDPFILRSIISRNGFNLKMVESAKSINYSMPDHVADLAKQFSDGRKRVIVAGVAFKGDTDDTRFTPAFGIINDLEKNGFKVTASDPFVSIAEMEIDDDIYSAASGAEIILILSDHSAYKKLDLKKLRSVMGKDPLIIDTRGIFSKETVSPFGFEFHGLGRI